jgi:peptidoglycan/xylan/chitin deacetylase (PgdA/CDA1 family)
MGVRSGAVMVAKKAVKAALLPPASIGREREPGLFVLIYHRVGAGMGREMDLPLATFRRQMKFLREGAEVVALSEGVARLSAGSPPGDLVAITFDDGYRDVFTRAWPVLRDLGLPATLFLATAFLEGKAPAPIRTGAADAGEPALPLEWEHVNEMTASGLVEVGAHSHTHRDFDQLTPEEARKECERSDAILGERVEREVESFAYPRAVVGNEDIVRARYGHAVAGLGGKNVARSFDRHAITRTPVRASDGMFFFRRRLAGLRPLEDRLYERLRGGRT